MLPYWRFNTATPIKTGMLYFPPNMWGSPPNFHANLSGHVSETLLDLDEYPLWQEPSVASVYRFLWLRTFHHPICVMVTEAEQGAGNLTAKILSSPQEQGSTPPKSGMTQWVKRGKTYDENTHALTSGDYQAIQMAFEEARFWEMPSTDDYSGRDGSIWVLEAVANGQYHAVMRWSPRTGVFRETALRMLAISGIIGENIY